MIDFVRAKKAGHIITLRLSRKNDRHVELKSWVKRQYCTCKSTALSLSSHLRFKPLPPNIRLARALFFTGKGRSQIGLPEALKVAIFARQSKFPSVRRYTANTEMPIKSLHDSPIPCIETSKTSKRILKGAERMLVPRQLRAPRSQSIPVDLSIWRTG